VVATKSLTDRSRLADALSDASLLVLLAGLPLAVVYANRSAQTVLGVVLLLAIAARIAAQGHGDRGDLRTDPLAQVPAWAYALLAGIVFAAISATWSVDPRASVERAMKLAAMTVMGLALWWFLPPVTRPPHRMLAIWAIGLAAVVSAVELSGDGVLRQQFYSRNPSDMNRTVVTLSLLMWPALALMEGAKRPIVSLVLAVAVAAAVFMTQSVSAQLGLLVAVAAFLIALASTRIAVPLLAASSAAAFLLLPFLIRWTFGPLHGALQAIPVRTEPEIRLEIWDLFAGAIFEKPILGWGLESTRFFGERDLSHVAPGFVWESHGWHHPHNLVIQVWVELGAIGAVLFTAAITLACLAIRRLPEARRPHVCAFFAGAFSIAVVSHGAWQTWWLALLAAGIVMFVLEDRIGAETARGNGTPTS
jgi:exopolysaccharide production protein ExoQ